MRRAAAAAVVAVVRVSGVTHGASFVDQYNGLPCARSRGAAAAAVVAVVLVREGTPEAKIAIVRRDNANRC